MSSPLLELHQLHELQQIVETLSVTLADLRAENRVYKEEIKQLKLDNVALKARVDSLDELEECRTRYGPQFRRGPQFQRSSAELPKK